MTLEILGYIYSSKLNEKFLELAKNRGLNIVLFDISKPINDLDLANMEKCDLIYNDSGEDFSLIYVKIFEEMGIPVVESSKAIKSENKWTTYLLCLENNIPSPRTILLSKELDEAKNQLQEFNSWPVILKRVNGTWGEYVEKANDIESALLIIKKFWDKGNRKLPIIAQEFFDSFSYRVTYIDKEIVQTAIKENNNWKCTGVYAQKFKKFEIDPELKIIVNRVMNAFPIKTCGIDLIKKDNKWYVIEVNTEPATDFFPEETEMLYTKMIDMFIKISNENKKLIIPIQSRQKSQNNPEKLLEN